MNRFLSFLLLSAAVTAALVIRARDDAAPATSAGMRIDRDVRQSESVREDSGRLSTEGAAGSKGSTETSDEVPSELLQRANWTNPYTAAVWNAPGWQFNEDSMTTLEADVAADERLRSAEFLREWSSFAAAFRVEFPAGSESTQLVVMEVVGTKSADTLRITLQTDQAIVESVHNGEAVPLRETPLTTEDELSDIRLSLTPNRFLVRVGSRMLINGPRPRALIGDDCRFRVSVPAGSAITELRFDGE